MFCENCGTSIGDTSEFCNSCGTKITRIGVADDIRPVVTRGELRLLLPAGTPQSFPRLSLSNLNRHDGGTADTHPLAAVSVYTE